MIGGPRNAASDQAKLPHNATFVRLGRTVWFTLEHSFRARGEGEELSNRLTKLKEQQDQIAQMGISWMRIGSFDKRRTWNDDEWIAFLRTCLLPFSARKLSTTVIVSTRDLAFSPVFG